MQGKWKHVWVCAHARKCSCPFMLEFKHDGAGTVSIWQSGTHHFHEPSSAADRATLKLSPEVECQILLLLESGVRPLKIRNAIYSQYKPSDADSSWLDFGDARFCPTLAQITALRKRMLRDQGLNLTSDPAALAASVPRLQEAGCLGYYQPYQEPCTPEGEGQPLIIILQTPFQKRMLNEFGGRLVHLDATFGTNKYGYPLYAVVVRWGGVRSVCSVPCTCSATLAAPSPPLPVLSAPSHTPTHLLGRCKMRAAWAYLLASCLSASTATHQPTWRCSCAR